MVTITRLEGRRLLCRSGPHQVITDRKPDEGGADSGCTSGELLLMAIGSCAAGAVRRHLEARGRDAIPFAVDVTYEPSPTGQPRDMIRVEVRLAPALAGQADEIAAAALTGRVASRVSLGSEIEVRTRVEHGLAPEPAVRSDLS